MSDLFRVYDGENDMVKKTYYEMITKQTLDYVLEMKKKYAAFPKMTLGLWDVLKVLDTIVDESDPDNDLPQYVHAY